MGLNFQQVIEKIKEIGLYASTRLHERQQVEAKAESLLKAWANQAGPLQEKVERARQFDPFLRCALPLTNPLDATHDPVTSLDIAALLAADGSQIIPDRHEEIQFGLVNVGGLLIRPGTGQAPYIFTQSELLFGPDLLGKSGPMSAEEIELRRDIAERRALLEESRQVEGPLLALTDGPLELWGIKNAGEQDYNKNLKQHLSILSQLRERGVIVAGYVEKPGANLFIRTLELASLPDDQLKEGRAQHPLQSATDRWLFGQILKPGQRSAVFALQSMSRQHYTGDLSIHFFYLNVGDSTLAWPARIEVPRWVAEDPAKLDLLHAGLLEQCQHMGARPYPYILHHAHEIAVVKEDDKRQLGLMISLELRKAGQASDLPSHKKSAKDLPARGRNR